MLSGEDQNGRWVAVYLPSKEQIRKRTGYSLSDDAYYEEYLEYIKKGIDVQLDWDILIDCATEVLETGSSDHPKIDKAYWEGKS